MAALWIVCLIIGIWLGERKKRTAFAVVICLCLGPMGLAILSVFPTRLASDGIALPNLKALYEQVANEIDAAHIDRAAWARSIADSNGSPDVAKSLYIKYRVEHLASEINAVRYARRWARAKEIFVGGGASVTLILVLAYVGSDRGKISDSSNQSPVTSPQSTVAKTEQKFDPDKYFEVEGMPTPDEFKQFGGRNIATHLASASPVNFDGVPVVSTPLSERSQSNKAIDNRRKQLVSELSFRNEAVYKLLPQFGVPQTIAQGKALSTQLHMERTFISIEGLRSVGGVTQVTPGWWNEQLFDATTYPIKDRITLRSAVNECFQTAKQLNELDNTDKWWQQDPPSDPNR